MPVLLRFEFKCKTLLNIVVQIDGHGLLHWGQGELGRSSFSSLIVFSVSALTLSSLWAYALCEEMNSAGTPQGCYFQDLCDL